MKTFSELVNNLNEDVISEGVPTLSSGSSEASATTNDTVTGKIAYNSTPLGWNALLTRNGRVTTPPNKEDYVRNLISLMGQEEAEKYHDEFEDYVDNLWSKNKQVNKELIIDIEKSFDKSNRPYTEIEYTLDDIKRLAGGNRDDSGGGGQDPGDGPAGGRIGIGHEGEVIGGQPYGDDILIPPSTDVCQNPPCFRPVTPQKPFETGHEGEIDGGQPYGDDILTIPTTDVCAEPPCFRPPFTPVGHKPFDWEHEGGPQDIPPPSTDVCPNPPCYPDTGGGINVQTQDPGIGIGDSGEDDDDDDDTDVGGGDTTVDIDVQTQDPNIGIGYGGQDDDPTDTSSVGGGDTSVDNDGETDDGEEDWELKGKKKKWSSYSKFVKNMGFDTKYIDKEIMSEQKRKKLKDFIKEAETLHWDGMKKPEREDFLKHAGLLKSYASKNWGKLNPRTRMSLQNMIKKTTEGEFALEEEMSDAQKKKKEEIVLSMKKKKKEFQDRYGDEWESVMHATATKMAKNESVNEDWEEPSTPFTPNWDDWQYEQELQRRKEDADKKWWRRFYREREDEYLDHNDNPYPIHTPDWYAWILQHLHDFAPWQLDEMLQQLYEYQHHMQQGHTYQCTAGDCNWYDAEGNCVTCNYNPTDSLPDDYHDHDLLPGRPDKDGIYPMSKTVMGEAIVRGDRSGGMPTGADRGSEEKPLMKWLTELERELKKVRSSYDEVDADVAIWLYQKGRNPKETAKVLASKNESLDEVNATRYTRVHGKTPRGTGLWMFTIHPGGVDFDKHKEGKDYVKVNDNYGVAAKKAEKMLKSKKLFVGESFERPSFSEYLSVVNEKFDVKAFIEKIKKALKMRDFDKSERERAKRMKKANKHYAKNVLGLHASNDPSTLGEQMGSAPTAPTFSPALPNPLEPGPGEPYRGGPLRTPPKFPFGPGHATPEYQPNHPDNPNYDPWWEPYDGFKPGMPFYEPQQPSEPGEERPAFDWDDPAFDWLDNDGAETAASEYEPTELEIQRDIENGLRNPDGTLITPDWWDTVSPEDLPNHPNLPSRYRNNPNMDPDEWDDKLRQRLRRDRDYNNPQQENTIRVENKKLPNWNSLDWRVRREYMESLSEAKKDAWLQITDIYHNHQAEKVHGVLVDAQTAQLLNKVYDSLKDRKNKKSFINTINKDRKGLQTMVNFSWSMTKKESVNEARMKDDIMVVLDSIEKLSKKHKSTVDNIVKDTKLDKDFVQNAVDFWLDDKKIKKMGSGSRTHYMSIDEEIPSTNTAGVAHTGDDPRVGVKRKKKKKKGELSPRGMSMVMGMGEAKQIGESLERSLRSLKDGNESPQFRSDYCGHPVFKVSEGEYGKCKTRRAKGERWNKFFEDDSPNYGAIRKYSKRNPNKPIVLQNELNGEMSIFRRRMNDNRLKHNKRIRK